MREATAPVIVVAPSTGHYLAELRSTLVSKGNRFHLTPFSALTDTHYAAGAFAVGYLPFPLGNPWRDLIAKIGESSLWASYGFSANYPSA